MTQTTAGSQALRTVLSLPESEPLQLAGTLDQVPPVPSAADLQRGLTARADIQAIGSWTLGELGKMLSRAAAG